jgi:hypothetical protein
MVIRIIQTEKQSIRNKFCIISLKIQPNKKIVNLIISVIILKSNK